LWFILKKFLLLVQKIFALAGCTGLIKYVAYSIHLLSIFNVPLVVVGYLRVGNLAVVKMTDKKHCQHKTLVI